MEVDKENDENEQKALKALAQCFESTDHEMNHAMADEALCELLEALGYHLVVAQWRAVKKWYA